MLLLLLALVALAEERTDSIGSAQELKEVVVEAKLQSTSATVSTYIPTSRQKTASQTGTDLLRLMGIPQITIGVANSVTTAAGQNVAIYIDYLPASEQDMNGMRMADVKRVEYYDYPSDPRFQGNAHVINFIMQKYEYGGYVKAFGKETFIANVAQLNLYSKLQYKRMTYDIALGAYDSRGSHNYTNTTEQFRMPQPDGTVKNFERVSEATESEYHNRYFWPTVKILYKSDKITLNNTIGANLDYYPKENSAGYVSFSPEEFERTNFSTNSNRSNNSITYSGNWNFILPHNNTIIFHPYYSYSHTGQTSIYTENEAEYYNASTDNTHRVDGYLRFMHSFGKWGSLSAYCLSSFSSSNTEYTGTAKVLDRQKTFDLGPGVSYNYTSEKFYGFVAAGVSYNYSKFADMDIKEKSLQPWADFNLQYSINSKNSAEIGFHHATFNPSLAYRSNIVIQSNPLMRYTGNPHLRPYKTVDAGVSYTYMPTSKLSFTAFGNIGLIKNRYTYVYQADADGILRTIGQPMGAYTSLMCGLTASLRLLQNSLQFSGQLTPVYVHDGAPFNYNKSAVNYWLQAQYYYNNWNFGAVYISRMGNSAGSVSGVWNDGSDAMWATIGWGNENWNVKGILGNPYRWNWKTGSSVMKSQYYDVAKVTYAQDCHAYLQIAATYTFGFGKKIQIGDEATQQTGASSAILK